MQIYVIDWSLSILPSPISEFQHTPLPLQSAESQGTCPELNLSIFFYLRLLLESVKELGNASGNVFWIYTRNSKFSSFFQFFLLPSGENSPPKNPFGSDFFCEKCFGIKILLWIPIFLDKISTKKGKNVKELLIFLQLHIIWKVLKNFLIWYFKYHQIWLSGLMDGIWTTL